MQITLAGVLTILEAAAADYSTFEAGTPVHIPEVDATLGTTKVALDLVVTKKAAGSALPGLNLTEALGLFSDFAAFEAGTTVSLPEVDVVLGSTVVGLALSVHKA